ncbi:hypothetical protein OSCT_1256 [Oscillochloris trichoides DG-6]|uniref:Late embryogenesis abundant protein n=1 Tax=Oscillochloris trichoides DG-6 TaxID=765420 RepID=E1ID55_9CHLR|nr:YtxH domain-containing protein [Oscillochloris trichoides]EFO80887.1 hypothetical protein OSCT_1256 [Oscillochloris trichoides DG-6]
MNFRKNKPTTKAHAEDTAHQAADYLRSHSADEMADDVRDKVGEMTDDVRDKVGEMTDDVRDKADKVVGTVREKSDEIGTHASAKINGVISGASQKVSDIGTAIRKHTTWNQSDKATLSDALERSEHYLEDQDVDGIRGGIETFIRRYPIPVLVISVVVSFILGRKIFR